LNPNSCQIHTTCALGPAPIDVACESTAIPPPGSFVAYLNGYSSEVFGVPGCHQGANPPPAAALNVLGTGPGAGNDCYRFDDVTSKAGALLGICEGGASPPATPCTNPGMVGCTAPDTCNS